MEKIKQGGEEITIGHMVRAKIVKNKTAPPFRKAEFMIYYDGRKMDSIEELAGVLLIKGMIPRYKADGTLDEKGRNFHFEYEGEVLDAKKRDDVYPALMKCPKIQEYFLNKLKAGEADSVDYSKDDEMTEDEFEASLLDENSNEAEEVENGWDGI